jgi:Predicted nucleotide-binding protein containing TIR-like domain
LKHHIFVGSSTEALGKAQHACDILAAQDDLTAHLWTEIFEPGFLTFEALERMLRQCCAAVFIATGDDLTTMRDRVIESPRANILLEFGLVAGRLGHHSVSICQYGAVLPSDLAGLTVICMEPPQGHPDPDRFRSEATEKLVIWSSRLLATASGIPRTEVVHGYTGRWDFDISLQQWRDLAIASPGYAQVKGYLDLILSASGQVGRGLAHGELQFKLVDGNNGTVIYQGEYRTAHEIRNAVCAKDGSLDLTTEAFSLQRIQTTGTPPLQLAGMDVFPEPWSAHWKLTPSTDHTLSGTVRSEGSVATEGKVTVSKRDP